MAPLVSVLMPAHNAAQHVGAALTSLAEQSFTDFEVVLVVDEAREDEHQPGTAAAARQTMGDDPRLRTLEPGRVGLIKALQIGLEACRGTLVARMDADDLCEPNRLAAQTKLLRDENADLVSCLVRCFGDGGIAEGYRLYQQWQNGVTRHDDIVREIFVESPLPHPSVMFSKTAVLEVGGYRDRGWPEDYDLWLRMARAGLHFAKVPQILLNWRDSQIRHSRTHERYHADAFLRCKAHHLARWPRRGEHPVIIWGAGKIGRRLGKYLLENRVEIVAFVDIDPVKVGRVICGATVIPPQKLGAPKSAGPFLIAAVGARGARQLIRQRLTEMGWQEGDHWICAA